MVIDGVLVTTVVGSYPQPDWLVNREMLGSRLPPRVRAKEIWRIPEEFLAEAQDDATIIAIRDMERAGIEIITDGEIRRESYSNRFATALDGMDVENPGTAIDRTGHPNPVPRAVGPIQRTRPVEVGDLEFLRRNTGHPVKITIPGPFTMAQQAQDDFYGDRRSLALALADAVRAEVADLFAAGADIVQLDEPYLQARPEAAREYAVEAINRAIDGLPGPVALHTCFGYAAIVHERPPGYSFLAELNDCAAGLIAIETAQPGLDLSILKQLPGKTVILGVVDLSTPDVESPESIAARIREALRYHPPHQLQIAPDCGMKYLPRPRAFAKLQAMTEAVALVRRELA
ncbi:uroporphyrinogen decarboxylase family protein [Acrocarpospora macrocephala]|uniref:uroporphyrinogen decarboxylase family protein n=1 Tax=Acrocarpospora macrocephala TaxID=150177 RepID=UPI0012D2E571|nr:uroporphyrinogen decarboxylase family protein [Acrocarpospora macrocephala]